MRAARLLDTAPEEDFDSLTRLAIIALGAAASFVSIAEDGRDFHKSQAGSPEASAWGRELHAFASQRRAPDGHLAIGDTREDPALKAEPAVSSPGGRAYLAAPILVDGEPVGSFCVVDAKPREWSPSEIGVVAQFAKSTAREIELRAALASSEEDGRRLRALARANEELVAIVAHDLRSPLQAMSITASMLARSTDPAIQGHASRMSLAAESMRRLVDDLLASKVAEADAPPLRHPVSVAKLLDDAAQAMGPIAGRAGVSLAKGPIADADVLVDYAQMLRALCNLVGNCLKYCPGATVTLSAYCEADAVRLFVADDGPGIRAEDLPRVFESGFQGLNGAELGQGVGLGLSIVRSLVERNDGSVKIASVEGVGTTVEIDLPC